MILETTLDFRKISIFGMKLWVEKAEYMFRKNTSSSLSLPHPLSVCYPLFVLFVQSLEREAQRI